MCFDWPPKSKSFWSCMQFLGICTKVWDFSNCLIWICSPTDIIKHKWKRSLICNSLVIEVSYLPKCILQFYEWPPKSKSSWSCMQFLGKPRSVIFPAMQCIKGNLFLLLSLIIQETFPTKPVGLVCPRLASPSCPSCPALYYRRRPKFVQ